MAGGNTAYSWARIPLPAPFRESSPRPRAVVSPMSSSQGGTLKIPASLALGAGPPHHTHTRPQRSVETLSWLLWTPSSLHPQGPERDPRIPQPLGTAALTTGSLDARTPAPLACILETASQSPPDTTAGTLGFMLAAAPPDPPSAPLLCPPVHSSSSSGCHAPQGLFSLPGGCD